LIKKWGDMNTCGDCGAELYESRKYCGKCGSSRIIDKSSERQSAQEAEMAKRLAEAEEKREREARQLAQIQAEAEASFKDWELRARARIAMGEKPQLFTWLYQPVDSIVENYRTEEFGIADLQEFGLGGWKLVSVVPRTVGIGLKNTSMGSTFGESWGGGVGGNVIGVYFILQKEILDLDSPSDREEAQSLYTHLYIQGFRFNNLGTH
jgi:hypothetical protein